MNTLTEDQRTPRLDPEQMSRPLDFSKLRSGKKDDKTETDRLALAFTLGVDAYNEATGGNETYPPIDSKTARLLKMFVLGAMYPPLL